MIEKRLPGCSPSLSCVSTVSMKGRAHSHSLRDPLNREEKQQLTERVSFDSIGKDARDDRSKSLTLTFFHQYLRFNLLALVVNCDAPVCSASERQVPRQAAIERTTGSRARPPSSGGGGNGSDMHDDTHQRDFQAWLIWRHVRGPYRDYLSSHRQPRHDMHAETERHESTARRLTARTWLTSACRLSKRFVDWY